MKKLFYFKSIWLMMILMAFLASHPGVCNAKDLIEADIPSTAIELTPTEPPANDDFENATQIPVLPFTDSINTVDATSAADDSYCCYYPYNTVWYSFTPMNTTDMHISANTFGSDYDTVLTVVTGSPGNFSCIACNDDSGGRQSCVSFDAIAGETYYIMVNSYGGVGGNLVFNVDVAPPTPPLTIDLKVDEVNFVDNGITIVSGTVNSSVPADVQVQVQVRQKAGRVFITGYGSAYFSTSNGGHWAMQVPGDIGPFLPGKATVRAYAFGCAFLPSPCSGYEYDCIETPELSTTVRLQPVKKNRP